MPNPLLRSPGPSKGLVAFILVSPGTRSGVPGRPSILAGGSPGFNKLHYISQKWIFHVMTQEFHTTATSVINELPDLT